MSSGPSTSQSGLDHGALLVQLDRVGQLGCFFDVGQFVLCLGQQACVVVSLGLSDADAIADWGHAQGAATVVVKLGADGVLLSSADPAVPRQRVPGRSVPLVDATGAGDCFDGNLLARLALGDDLAAAVAYANTAASLAVQGFGAVAPLPTAEQVRAVMPGL